MCFSTSASFGAGIVLSAIGIATIKKAKEPRQIFFASIPFLFAIQQISEGFLWLALSDPAYGFLKQVTTYIFLAFAQIVWPFFVPLSIMLLEQKSRRKTIHKILLFIGTALSIVLGYCLVTFPVEASISGYHIAYRQDYPAAPATIISILYITATIAPPFSSSVKHMWYLGTAILISYIMTKIFYADYIVSVWCFFASIISIAVYAVMVSQSPIKTIRHGTAFGQYP